MSTSPHLQLSTLPRPHDFTPSLADVLSSTSVLSLSSSTPSPPESPNLVMALASRIPPELLLDIFSIVSDSPSKDHKQYLERNRNLKSFALVHSTWKDSAQEILRQEVYVTGPGIDMMDGKGLERISSLLIGSKVQGTKYLTVDAHLNELIAKTGSAIWSQVRYLKLLTSSRNDSSTRMGDFACFPNIQALHLEERYTTWNSIDFKPSDKRLRFPELRRITIDRGVDVGRMSQASKADLTKRVEQLVAIALTLFSPSKMPNLRQLAMEDGPNESFACVTALLHRLRPRVTALAIKDGDDKIVEPLANQQIFPNLKHLSLNGSSTMVETILDHKNVALESLHLSSWMVAEDEELLARLLKIAKREDPHNRIGRIVIYGSRKEIETELDGPTNDLDAFEWREDREEPPFEDFDGR